MPQETGDTRDSLRFNMYQAGSRGTQAFPAFQHKMTPESLVFRG